MMRAEAAGARAYWLCQAGGWLVLALFGIALNLGAGPSALPRLIGVYAWAGSAGILVTHGWRAWLRRSGALIAPSLYAWLRLAPQVVLLALLMVLLTALGFALFQPFGAVRGWHWLPGAVLSWIVVMAGWILSYSLAISARRARQLGMDALRHKAEVHQAELRALQAKVNPHFFFNSLNSLRALVFEDQEAAARMIDQLATLMRHALASNHQGTVRLADELHAVRAYLAIEQIRFEERLRVSIDIGPGLDELAIPPMALQTLVENAVKYGVEPSPDGSEVRIAARRDGSAVELTVANQGVIRDGAGSTRIGLDSVSRRLALTSNGPAQLTLSAADGWVTARIRTETPT